MITNRASRGIAGKWLVGVLATAALVGGSVVAGTVPALAAPLPAGEYLFVSVSDGSPTGDVAVLDRNSGEVVASLPVNGVPNTFVTAPDQSVVYAVTDDGVTVIDAQNLVVLGSIAARPDVAYQSIELSSDGATLYALAPFDNLVDVFDTKDVLQTKTGTLLASIPVDGDSENPTELELSPDDSELYVANGLSKSVDVIDTVTNTVVGTIDVPGFVNGMTVSPDGSRIYVGTFGRGFAVHVLSTSTRTTEANWSLPRSVTDMVVSLDGTKLYVVQNLSGLGNLAVIETATGAVTSSTPDFSGGLTLGGSPTLSTDGGTLYLAALSVPKVLAIDTADLSPRELTTPHLFAWAVAMVDVASPVITSMDTASFAAGVPVSTEITATGSPAPTISVTGTLPPGVTFSDAGNGTGTITGTPTTPGTYPVTITAANPKGTVTQTLTVTVVLGPPTILTTAGANQSTAPGTQFPTQLVVTVTDGAGNPLPNIPVTFTIDPAGAASFSGIDTFTEPTNPKGTARAPFVTAGPTPGPVTVTVTVPNLTPATLPLTIELAPGPQTPPTISERLTTLEQALSDGNRTSRRLIPLIHQAGNQIDRGHPRTACTLLRTFTTTVGVFARTGQLTPTQADQYTTDATTIRNQLHCP